MSSDKVHEYVIKPFIYTSMYIKVATILFKIKPVKCGLECDAYEYKGDKIPLYLVVDKNDGYFDKYMPLLIKHSDKYHDHIQLGDSNSNLVLIVLETNDDKNIELFKQGKYSSMYKTTMKESKYFRDIYTDNKVKGLDYSKEYYALTHNIKYFEHYIYPLIDNLDGSTIREIMDGEYDSVPEENDLIINTKDLLQKLNSEEDVTHTI